MTDPERAVIPDAAVEAANVEIHTWGTMWPTDAQVARALAAASPLMGGAGVKPLEWVKTTALDGGPLWKAERYAICVVHHNGIGERYHIGNEREQHVSLAAAKAAAQADYEARVRSAILPTGNTDRTRADYDLRCDICGRAHILDTVLPSEIWNQIAAPEAVLCTTCIDDRLVAKGLSAEAEFYFSGSALVSKLYATGKAEGNAEAGAEVAGLVEAAAIAGWNACRRSIYAVCEDVQEKASNVEISLARSETEKAHEKGYYSGEVHTAKSIARGFNAMEAMDDDNLRAALTSVDRRA